MDVPLKAPKKSPARSASVAFDRFAAIDFETADYGRDSACAVGVVIVAGGRIEREHYTLIRPPRRQFAFTYLHGIGWRDVEDKPVFGELWPQLRAMLEGVEFIAAHNASFDRGVLAACCTAHGHPALETPYVCTMKLARRLWQVRPTKLPDVCRHFGFSLEHHDAASDARACANIVIQAAAAGIPKGAFLGR